MNSHPRVTCANSSFFSQVDQFRIARDTTTIRKQPSCRLLNPADYSGLSSDAADEKQIRHPSLRKPPPPGSFQSHSVLVYRLAAELQTLVPLWISPESKEARGRQLRTGQTEGGTFLTDAETRETRGRDFTAMVLGMAIWAEAGQRNRLRSATRDEPTSRSPRAFAARPPCRRQGEEAR
jgi:hypothetical protein